MINQRPWTAAERAAEIARDAPWLDPEGVSRFIERQIEAASAAAYAAGFAAGRDAAERVCRERVNRHDANAYKYIVGAPEFHAHTLYGLEAEECADAIAALQPVAADKGE